MNSNTRLSIDDYFLKIALLVSQRGTCARRQVGCVLVNEKNQILATGYNGVARTQEHCIDSPCKGALAKSGEDLHLCEAIHAEQNAILQCPDVELIRKVYVTVSPCNTCTKLLLNTGAKNIIFIESYPDSDTSRGLWFSILNKRSWIQVSNVTA